MQEIKQKNIHIVPVGASLLEKASFKAVLDGEKAPDKPSLLKELGVIFKFPDYYGKNYDAAAEMLNDLDWLENSSYTLVIRNYDELLKGEDAEGKRHFLEFINDIASEWKSVPNFDGEEEYRIKSEFNIFIERTGNVLEDLKAYGIEYSEK